MLFHVLCFLFCLVVTFGLAFFATQSGVKQWKLEGPLRVSERLARRNQKVLFILLAILVVVAFFEAIIPDFSYLVQDFQADTLNVVLPDWVILIVGNGSFSWVLYLSILLGVGVGLLLGTMYVCRQYGELRGIGLSDIIWPRRRG